MKKKLTGILLSALFAVTGLLSPTIAMADDSSWQNNWEYTLEDNKILLKRYVGDSDVNLVVPAKATVDGVEYNTYLSKPDHYTSPFAGRGYSSISFEDGVKTQSSASYMFCDIRVNSLDLNGLDTSEATSMYKMFSGISATELDTSMLNTSNVTDMGNMFEFSHSLESLTVNGMDTSKVKYWDYMFADTWSLLNLDVSELNTDSAIYENNGIQANMFANLGHYGVDGTVIAGADSMFTNNIRKDEEYKYPGYGYSGDYGITGPEGVERVYCLNNHLAIPSYQTSTSYRSNYFKLIEAEDYLGMANKKEDQKPLTEDDLAKIAAAIIYADNASSRAEVQSAIYTVTENDGSEGNTYYKNYVLPNYESLKGRYDMHIYVSEDKEVQNLVSVQQVYYSGAVLSVTKETQDEPIGTKGEFEVSLTVNDENGKPYAGQTLSIEGDFETVEDHLYTLDNNGQTTFKIKSGDTVKIYNLPVGGTYKINENKTTGYKLVGVENTSGDIVEGETSAKLVNKFETIEIPVVKTWNDDNNRDGKRPDKITVHLMNNKTEIDTKTITAADNWECVFQNLPKYNNGQEIAYTITEDAITDYTTSINDFAITNTHNPSFIKIEGKKIWNDNNDQDGIRPEKVTVKLLKDGVEVDRTEVTDTFKFENLFEYENGKKIKYTIIEENVDGYTADISDNYTITNTHVPATINITGSKTWDDNNNQDGIRPEKITVKLLKNGKEIDSQEVTDTWTFSDLPEKENGKTIAYTIKEEAVDGYETVIQGYNVVNKHTPETINITGFKTWDDADDQDGKRPDSITVNLLADGVEVDEKKVSGDWVYNFDGLPKYKAGKEITYTVTEDKVAGYTTTINGYDIINTHTPETIKIEGSKTWDDADNQDGRRPEDITINLFADGERVDSKRVSGIWKWLFDTLAKYKDGKEINYTITEDKVDEYTSIVDGYNVTNKYIPKKTEINVIKTWNDADNQDGKRPLEVTVNLLADGEKIDSKTIAEKDNWMCKFDDLPQYKEGKEISYTVMEEPVANYTSTVDGYNITNSYTPGKTQVDVVKVWDDANNQDGKRPESVTVKLFADGQDTGKTLEISEADKWTGSFTGLDEFKAGKKITYTIDEADVAGYAKNIDGYTITNSYTPEVISVEGVKTWDDADNKDGIRPESITINLLADGEQVDSVEAVDTYSFKDLPKYKDGKEIVYTIAEVPVDGYETIIDGYNITNKHTLVEKPIETPTEKPTETPTETLTEKPVETKQVEKTVDVKTGDASTLPMIIIGACALVGMGLTGFAFKKRKSE